ncbi:hypothetical protein HanLR1_Chr11g0414761 [Helianthus annuus]|nr:hypothetical protein HanHA89_Chr11g0437081 [Helianthus annuus]KAJ0686440.1 hypothetical protein HanLR1_Chr11g0414761 [Helianthus annuus]
MTRHGQALTQTLLYHTRRPFARNTKSFRQSLSTRYIKKGEQTAGLTNSSA